MDASTPNSDTKQNALLKEYELAQASAQHHDWLGWSSVNFIVVSNFGLFALVVSNMDKAKATCLLLLACVLAVVCTALGMIIPWQFIENKTSKYSRCKEIEQLLGANLHQGVPAPRFIQKKILVFLVIVFATLWISTFLELWYMG